MKYVNCIISLYALSFPLYSFACDEFDINAWCPDSVYRKDISNPIRPDQPFVANISHRWEGNRLFIDLNVKNIIASSLAFLPKSLFHNGEPFEQDMIIINERDIPAKWIGPVYDEVYVGPGPDQLEKLNSLLPKTRLKVAPGQTVKVTLDVFKYYKIPPKSKVLTVRWTSDLDRSNAIDIPLPKTLP